RIDLGLKASHDLGRGSRTREDFETIVDLTVSVPLERNRGTGLVSESRARLRQLELDRRLAEDRLANEVRKLSAEINAAREFVSITAQEASQALVMEQAERKRFAAGASDFFLVNLREEMNADAQVRNLDAKLRYFRALADFHAATMNLGELGM
ncbi:MAG: TolC family protein, partial [Gammaproteobacteria bacterium]